MVTVIALVAQGCAHQKSAGLQRFEFTEPQMGIPFRLVFYASDSATANFAAKSAYARVSRLNQIFSDYETDSELNQFSRTSGTGQQVALSKELFDVLSMAQNRSQQSDGAFDVTVGPIVTLWRKARREQKMPDPLRLTNALSKIGWTNLVLNSHHKTGRLILPNMHLDLGGIAKGYALDAALEVLKSHGCLKALVTGSGDMAVGDPPPGKTGWIIQLDRSSNQTNSPTRSVELRNCGFATSGDSSQHLYSGGVRYSHIVNPKTGLGLTNQSLVFVVAKNAVTADSLSTTLSVLGVIESMKIAPRLPLLAYSITQSAPQGVVTQESQSFSRYLTISKP